MDKIVNGTYFHPDTPNAVCRILDQAMNTPTRIRLFYGDTETGRDWMEEQHTMGYIGRSGGTRKVPLLIPSSRSYGGPAIQDHCIVRITSHGNELYRHPEYHQPAITTRGKEVFVDGKAHARFDSFSQVTRYVQFMQGERDTRGGR